MIHLPIFAVVFPGNTMLFYSFIAMIAQFDIIDTKGDNIDLVTWFQFDEYEEPYETAFE